MDNHEPYVDQYVEGYKASIDDDLPNHCPYSTTDLGPLCSWMAGFNDQKADKRAAIKRGAYHE